MIGRTISHYRILEKIGEGGMGVVYKAQDTKLNRTVALKFLPTGLHTHEPERARFLQEAQSASVLNHPNICTIHDIIEEGEQQAIVMELVEGTTLRMRMAEAARMPAGQGLRLTDTVTYAIQIGEALQEAHAKGIVHRDVKPENIMVNEKNQIKVMDFGLAKLKGSLKLTRTSSTVGTLAYMSPEHIEGNPVDARSDIFSFGIVLYEMLSGGHPPFRGEHEAALIYSIVNEEPDPIQRYRADIPSELTHILDRALEKDPADRYQSALDMVIDLRRLKKHSTKVTRVDSVRRETVSLAGQAQEQATAGEQRGLPPATQPVSSLLNRRYVWLGIAAVVLIAAGIYLFRIVTPSGVSTTGPIQATFTRLTDKPGVESFPDISPDGNFIVYTQGHPDHSSIFLQRVGGGNPINLTGDSKDFNEHARFSPDGQWIAFRSDRGGGGIFIMGSTGESVRRLSDFGHNPVWSPDGKEILCSSQYVFHPSGRYGIAQLWSIDTKTGTKRLVFPGDAVQPDWSPHGRRIAYWALPLGGGERDIWTIPASGGEPVPVTHDAFVDWDPVWSPDGTHLYFSSDRGGSMNLWRVPIDEESGKVLGDFEPLTTPSSWSGQLRISRDGRRVVYMSGESKSNIQKIAFDPRSEKVLGNPVPVTQGTKEISTIDPSPDGQHIAYGRWGKQEDIFLIRSDGSDLRQLTDDIYKDRRPRWSPDGKRIAFYSNRTGHYQAWSINPDGSGLAQLTKTSGGSSNYTEWLGDDMHIAYFVQAEGTFVLDLLPPLGERKPQQLTPIGGSDTLFYLSSSSPDGRMLAGSLSLRATGEDLPGVVVYSLETQTYSMLTDSGYAEAWLNDNRRVLYTRNEGIWIVDSRTMKSREILPPQPNTQVSDVRPSRDNRTLYFVSGTREADIWLATMK